MLPADLLGPEAVAQSRANLLSLIGGHVRELRRGSRFKAAEKVSRKKVADEDAVARRGDVASSSSGL